MVLFGYFYIGLSGPLILYLKSLSQNSALVQNYSHYSQSHNELSLGCAISVSVAIEEERGRGKVESGGVALTNCHFSHLKAMMSLSHGWAKFSGRAKQRKGR